MSLLLDISFQHLDLAERSFFFGGGSLQKILLPGRDLSQNRDSRDMSGNTAATPCPVIGTSASPTVPCAGWRKSPVWERVGASMEVHVREMGGELL